ncbi:mevalonate kinase [Nocardia blacklockiae]|uniref:mevalonate kinase n=1 Tax=Nocardia blacklockiae TaxID=480036 RepID=UPI0018961317|nr:mevalonate kinase [Nocardia blacklockiae]MBF6176597.1 mevalonate kinase [Nocardia blacklockiae]
MTSTDTAPERVLGTGHAHGKVILLGEHTVVYGMPAIAIPATGLKVEAVLHNSTASALMQPLSAPPSRSAGTMESKFVCSADTVPAGSGVAAATAAALRRWDPRADRVEVHIRSVVPPARGLGSSAAAAAAAVRAVADRYGIPLDERSLYSLVQVGEKVAHGRASGVDAAAAIARGPIRFDAGITRPIRPIADAVLVVADSGAAGCTRAAVDSVRAVLAEDHANARRILTSAGRLADAATAELEAGQLSALGVRLNEFQGLLRELGVSTPQLDRLIDVALRAGALGAKLTGGGLGGCLLALTEPRHASTVREALAAAGAARTWIVPMTQDCR